MMQENLQDMVKNLNSIGVPPVINESIKETKEDVVETKPEESKEIKLVNFYDWFEQYEAGVTTVSRVKTEVAKINSKDSMIFKIPKGKTEGEMELVSFYNPSVRTILNLPPVYVKIFKNDTFEVLHSYNDEIFIKSYGVKNGLIIMYCANVDGKVVPFEKIKMKKNVVGITLKNYDGIAETIKAKLNEPVDIEAIQLLYKQAIKFKDKFTTKESALNWFLGIQSKVVDINHLLKIDSVLINVI